MYKSKDTEIERLTLALLFSQKEKQYLEQRRDDAFNALLELTVERRRVLSVVQGNSSLMGMQYQLKARASQTRLEAHEETE